jgi:hypothetical protein
LGEQLGIIDPNDHPGAALALIIPTAAFDLDVAKARIGGPRPNEDTHQGQSPEAEDKKRPALHECHQLAE